MKVVGSIFLVLVLTPIINLVPPPPQKGHGLALDSNRSSERANTTVNNSEGAALDCPFDCRQTNDVVIVCHQAHLLDMPQLASCVKKSTRLRTVVFRSTSFPCHCSLVVFLRLTSHSNVTTMTPTPCRLHLLNYCDAAESDVTSLVGGDSDTTNVDGNSYTTNLVVGDSDMMNLDNFNRDMTNLGDDDSDISNLSDGGSDHVIVGTLFPWKGMEKELEDRSFSRLRRVKHSGNDRDEDDEPAKPDKHNMQDAESVYVVNAHALYAILILMIILLAAFACLALQGRSDPARPHYAPLRDLSYMRGENEGEEKSSNLTILYSSSKQSLLPDMANLVPTKVQLDSQDVPDRYVDGQRTVSRSKLSPTDSSHFSGLRSSSFASHNTRLSDFQQRLSSQVLRTNNRDFPPATLPTALKDQRRRTRTGSNVFRDSSSESTPTDCTLLSLAEAAVDRQYDMNQSIPITNRNESPRTFFEPSDESRTDHTQQQLKAKDPKKDDKSKQKHSKNKRFCNQSPKNSDDTVGDMSNSATESASESEIYIIERPQYERKSTKRKKKWRNINEKRIRCETRSGSTQTDLQFGKRQSVPSVQKEYKLQASADKTLYTEKQRTHPNARPRHIALPNPVIFEKVRSQEFVTSAMGEPDTDAITAQGQRHVLSSFEDPSEGAIGITRKCTLNTISTAVQTSKMKIKTNAGREELCLHAGDKVETVSFPEQHDTYSKNANGKLGVLACSFPEKDRTYSRDQSAKQLIETVLVPEQNNMHPSDEWAIPCMKPEQHRLHIYKEHQHQHHNSQRDGDSQNVAFPTTNSITDHDEASRIYLHATSESGMSGSDIHSLQTFRSAKGEDERSAGLCRRRSVEGSAISVPRQGPSSSLCHIDKGALHNEGCGCQLEHCFSIPGRNCTKQHEYPAFLLQKHNVHLEGCYPQCLCKPLHTLPRDDHKEIMISDNIKKELLKTKQILLKKSFSETEDSKVRSLINGHSKYTSEEKIPCGGSSMSDKVARLNLTPFARLDENALSNQSAKTSTHSTVSELPRNGRRKKIPDDNIKKHILPKSQNSQEFVKTRQSHLTRTILETDDTKARSLINGHADNALQEKTSCDGSSMSDKVARIYSTPSVCLAENAPSSQSAVKKSTHSTVCTSPRSGRRKIIPGDNIKKVLLPKSQSGQELLKSKNPHIMKFIPEIADTNVLSLVNRRLDNASEGKTSCNGSSTSDKVNKMNLTPSACIDKNAQTRHAAQNSMHSSVCEPQHGPFISLTGYSNIRKFYEDKHVSGACVPDTRIFRTLSANSQGEQADASTICGSVEGSPLLSSNGALDHAMEDKVRKHQVASSLPLTGLSKPPRTPHIKCISGTSLSDIRERTPLKLRSADAQQENVSSHGPTISGSLAGLLYSQSGCADDDAVRCNPRCIPPHSKCSDQYDVEQNKTHDSISAPYCDAEIGTDVSWHQLTTTTLSRRTESEETGADDKMERKIKPLPRHTLNRSKIPLICQQTHDTRASEPKHVVSSHHSLSDYNTQKEKIQVQEHREECHNIMNSDNPSKLLDRYVSVTIPVPKKRSSIKSESDEMRDYTVPLRICQYEQLIHTLKCKSDEKCTLTNANKDPTYTCQDLRYVQQGQQEHSCLFGTAKPNEARQIPIAPKRRQITDIKSHHDQDWKGTTKTPVAQRRNTVSQSRKGRERNDRNDLFTKSCAGDQKYKIQQLEPLHPVRTEESVRKYHRYFGSDSSFVEQKLPDTVEPLLHIVDRVGDEEHLADIDTDVVLSLCGSTSTSNCSMDTLVTFGPSGAAVKSPDSLATLIRRDIKEVIHAYYTDSGLQRDLLNVHISQSGAVVNDR